MYLQLLNQYKKRKWTEAEEFRKKMRKYKELISILKKLNLIYHKCKINKTTTIYFAS